MTAPPPVCATCGDPVRSVHDGDLCACGAPLLCLPCGCPLPDSAARSLYERLVEERS